MPVLWITGPAGVGKSTVSWQLLTELAGSGTPTDFADADQLCMCYPAPPDDPGRDLIRARNAGVVIANFLAAGAPRVILNGVVNPALGVRRDLLGQAAVMVCRLRAEPDEVVRRIIGRQQDGDGDLPELARQVRDECDRMDASDFADVCVDTTGVPAGEVTRLVRDRCGDWPGFRLPSEQRGAAPADPGRVARSQPYVSDGRVLLLCGPAWSASRQSASRRTSGACGPASPRRKSTWTRSGSSLPAPVMTRAVTGSRQATSRASGGPTAPLGRRIW